uniref:Mediator complex subunit Med12 LCEWAV-domain domain-containing protein n=1 Tax=Meloidogyne javanica TaxID=6303 RepID=A0A915MRM1_MELJA
MTQFTDIVVQNVFIARRVASILCSRLMQYRKDYEKMRSQNLLPIAPETCFDDLSNCQHHRPTLLVIFGFLHAIILDCPSALIWTPFEPQELLEGSLKSSKLSRAVEKENALQSVVWLCGSPLDYLPCKIEVTCQHFSGSFKDKILDLLNKKVDEIKMRSLAVEDRWAFINPSNSQFGIDVIIEECLNIISFLDTIPLDKPNALHILYENIFPKDEDLNESVGINIRVRILVLWAVTAERSGTYRSLLVTKLLLLLSKSENKANETSESQPERVEQQNSSKRQSVDLVPVKQEPQMIISFIPTTPSVSSTVNTNPFSGSTPQQNQQKSDEFAKLQQEYEPDVHPHLDIKSKLSFHERFLLHLPVEQLESNRDACNQRAIVLYGISDQRDQVRQDLRKIAREICKLWKRLSVEFIQTSPDSPTRELRYKRKCTNEQIAEQMDKFKSQTYFDQLIICGWCTENFVDSIEEFLRQLTEQQTVLSPFPTSECLDLLCEMIMICKNPHSLLSLSAELLPFLIQIEQEFQRSNQKIIFDTIPNSLTCQLAYVIVVHLAEHFYYFLYSPEACSIYNSLFKLIQNDLELSRQNFPITCWSRTIAIFLLHTRNKLIGVGEEEGKITKINLLGKYEDLAALFPSAGSGSLARNLKYDQQLMVDQLNLSSSNNFRFLSYVDLKMRLQTMQNEHSKYSFVVNAFRAANSYGRDYERLVELANFCAHVSTQLGLETEWCSAIQELCCSNVSNNSNWNEMLFEINVNDFSTHYSLATFVLLLASKYAFSPHALICRLIANVFYSIIREEGGNDLGQRVITSSTLRRDCNQVALKIAHITELNFVLFPLLSVVMQLVDELKRKVEASRKDATNHRKFSKQLAIARCALLSICDQDWVIERMHAICSSDKDMDNFINCPRLKNHSVGQQLLRVALRRKSERDIKQELMECTDKTIYEKLLSALSIWNMRATYFDFKLIINETFPESQMSKLGNGNQQLANHYQMTMFLFNNIATAIHQLFVSRLILKDNKQNEEKMDIDDFRPSGINCFWQIASLVTAMPSPPPPTGMSSQNPHWCPWIGSAMKAYILKVVAENLKTLPEKDSKNKQSENIEQLKYEQLLAYQPFLNLVRKIEEGEDVKQLVDTLLDYLDDVVARVRKNPIIPHQSFFLSERDGIILRLNLIVGLFDTLTTNSNAEFWASAIFQLLYFEILTYERDTLYFNTCMDMLLMLVHKMYPHKTYSTFVSKFKNFRIPDELYSLQQLLPVPKSQAELTAWDSFSNSIPHNKLIAQGTTTTTKGSTNTSQPSQQQT